MRVSTNTYDAQFGRTGGGVIAVSIRSGTNQYRGTAYYNHRDASLNGNLYENIQRGIPKDDLFHYNPGGTFGGPVKLPKYDGTNKSFFFYSFEGLKSGIPVSAGQRAPTELERAGNFSQSGVTIYDPLNGGHRRAAAVPRQPIPANRIDPVCAGAPEVHGGAEFAARRAGNNFFPLGNSRFDTYTSGILRVDHNFSANHRFFARYAHNGRRETRAKAGRDDEALTDGYHHRWNNVFSADLTSTFGPALVSSLRAGWTRHRRLDVSGAEDLGGFDSTTLRIPLRGRERVTAALLSHSHQRLRRRGHRAGGGQDGPADDFYVQESLTRIAGRHQLKFGGEFRYGISEIQNPLAGANIANLHSRATSRRSARPSTRSPRPTVVTRSRRSCWGTWRRATPCS